MKHHLLLLLLLMALCPAAAAAVEVSQHFDGSGKITEAVKRPASVSAAGSRKSPLPHGIDLRADVNYEFYPVFGKTFAEIVRSAEENGPVSRKTRKRRTSDYDWRLGWTYQIAFSTEYDAENEKVHVDIQIQDPALHYDITVILPMLTDDSALNPIEKELWRQYVAKVRDYEHGHVKIIRDDTRDIILKQFSDINYLQLDAGDGEEPGGVIESYVREATEKIGKDIVVRINARLAEYDASETKAGPESQGSRRRKAF